MLLLFFSCVGHLQHMWVISTECLF
uniref:Uncharacterized protein n=1 Tax=Anguilla anguilla TaxID=7936 RepID=A0A0E9UN88_ANGAN